jgi:putative MFS transporter
MDIQNHIGVRIDRLPTSKWHYKIFWLIGLGLLIDGVDNYVGGIVLAQLVKNGWSNNYLNGAFSSFTMGGLFIGSLLAGFLGDHLGRKFAYQINLLIFGLASIASAFVTNMTMLIALRGLSGIGLGAEIVVGFATFAEFISAQNRGKWSATLSLIGNCAPPLSTLFCLLVIPLLGPNYGWRTMFLICGAAALILWFARHNFPESPRWLESQGKYEEANKLICSIEKEIELEHGIKLQPISGQSLENSSNIKNISFTSLFKGNLLKRTILGSFILIGMNTALYSITTWIPTIFVKSGINITKSIVMTTLIMFGAPLGVFIATRIIDKFPRKWMGVILLILIAVLGYIYALQRSEILIIILGFLLIVFLYIYVCYASAVYIPELWPTEVRLRGSGICNAIGRIITIFTPFGVAWLMTNYGSVAVFITLGGILVFVALIIATIGIETRQKSIEEISIQKNQTTKSLHLL